MPAPSLEQINDTTFYVCPHEPCQRSMPSNHRCFNIHEVDTRTRCMHCKQLSKISGWKCSCGERWFLCSTHKRVPRPQTPGCATTNLPKSKKPRTPVTEQDSDSPKKVKGHQQLLQEDLDNEERQGVKRKADHIPIPLQTHNNCLVSRMRFGPIIAKRFCPSNSTSLPSCASSSSALVHSSNA